MPNTPALVKEGAAALARGSRATSDDAELARKLFSSVGTCDEVPEYQMDAVTALSGSGPAYVSQIFLIYLPMYSVCLNNNVLYNINVIIICATEFLRRFRQCTEYCIVIPHYLNCQ